MEMNETITKFGYPDTLLKEYEYWVVLLRPKQITLGCVVLACKEDAGRMPDVSKEAYAELSKVTNDLESSITKTFEFNKINYILLMMVDKEVHFHVIPRYDSTRKFGELDYDDPGWPKHPDMKRVLELSQDQMETMKKMLIENWPS